MDLKKLKNEFVKEIQDIENLNALEKLDQKYFSRKNGLLTEALKGIKDLSQEEKKTFGKELNELKVELTDSIVNKKQVFEGSESKDDFDYTLDSPKESWDGSIHPFNIVQRDIANIFVRMGFGVLDSQNIDRSFHNFDMLNFDQDHPARDTMDTFYLGGGNEYLLKTHNSTMQHRVLKSWDKQSPIKVILPGQAFRNEKIDATHDVVFDYVEGMFVDKNVTMPHLIWTLKTYLKEFFGKEMEIRIRPNFFPFVEPGIEMDMWYSEKEKWIEILGAGIIHDNVLKLAGVDPKIYSGFAFGFGLGRLTMIKYGLQDLRTLMSNDIRFLSQFK